MKYPFFTGAWKRPGKWIPVFFLSLCPILHGQEIQTGARTLGLGKCVAVQGRARYTPCNEANLGWSRQTILSAGHHRPFAIKNLGVSCLETAFPLFPGRMGFRIANYGIPGYQVFFSSIAFGMPLGESLAAGTAFRLYNAATADSWSYLWCVGVSAGISWMVTPETQLGVHIKNPVTVNNYPARQELFPSSARIGIRRKIYSATHLFGEVSYHSHSGLCLHIATEIDLFERLSLRSGYTSNPFTIAFGAGFTTGTWIIDIAFPYSPITGPGPAIQLTCLL